MAITNYLVHFKTKDTYDQTVVSNPLRNDAVAFIQDATIIRTHGTDYHCGSGPVALKSELATVATTGSYNDLIDKPSIPSLSGYATQSWVNTQLDDYLPLTGGTLTGSLFFKDNTAGILLVTGEGLGIKATNNGNDSLTLMGGGTFLELRKTGESVINSSPILTADNWDNYITSTDTKNTTGTSNNASKLFLVGGASQSATGVITYSNSAVYTADGTLYATQMNATSGFYETSDARLKNFKDDIQALDVISEIPTKYFTWKKDETDENSNPKLHIGTSAQEIQKIYPDLVTENEEGELLVDYARLSVIALAAIKELKKEIEELKSIKMGEGLNNSLNI